MARCLTSGPLKTDGDSGLLQSSCDLPIPGDRERCTPSNAPESRMSLTTWQAKSTPALLSLSRACASGSGTASSGISEESLRAIIAEGGAMTPAKTGPSKSMVPRHLNKTSSEKLTCTKRRCDPAHHADLVTDAHEVGSRSRLRFADGAERAGRHRVRLGGRPRVLPIDGDARRSDTTDRVGRVRRCRRS